MSAGYGTVVLSVQWSKGKGRVIPEATERIVARLKRSGMTLYEKVIERGQTQVVFEKVPVGEWVLEAEAQDRFGAVLAKGQSESFTLEANQNKQVTVELTAVALVVTGSGPTQVIGTRVAQGTPVSRIDANTFNISGVGTVLSPVNLDANNDGRLDTDVFVITAGSSPLGFPGFSNTDNAVTVVQMRARQQPPSVTVPINALGALLQNVALPPGDYEVTVENVIVFGGGNQLRIGEMAYAFSVFKDAAGNLHHTLPTAVSYRLPVVGQPVENVFLELTVDPAASTAGARGVLFVDHANGEINLTDVPVGTDGKVTFKAQPGGPTLGTVSFVGVGVLLP
jgi:phenylpyruvate tautomerase PptA (4-oxalocrotonate tautomerase family)